VISFICLFITIIIILIPIIAWIFVLIWVYRDAKGREMNSPPLWVLIVFLLDIIGLIIYILMRPKGSKTICDECDKKSLEEIEVCPFCGEEKHPNRRSRFRRDHGKHGGPRDTSRISHHRDHHPSRSPPSHRDRSPIPTRSHNRKDRHPNDRSRSRRYQ